ncbi:Mitochondrial brown fat uncoupling protein [Artemisia annua]|uniref:Mitochondrial brown fat uncoupling protein n=1 Tax=Artemisia annua TaxID=35608 RepID=A0A2U1LEY9_ARTAN|nr:Mitochondrial brown fat uncoupling protein [Artemisia annua]
MRYGSIPIVHVTGGLGAVKKHTKGDRKSLEDALDTDGHMHIGCARFFVVCVGSPVDVVKSRMMGDPSYKGTIDGFVKTLKNDVSSYAH